MTLPTPLRVPALLLAILWGLSACTHTTTGGVPGAVTFQRPGVLPQAPRPPSPLAAAPVQGRYAGEGRLTFNPGLRSACRETIPITGFAVAGAAVSFAGFRGPIDPEGAVTIQAGRRWLSGHFVGPNFEGRLWQPPPACTYAVSLAPVG